MRKVLLAFCLAAIVACKKDHSNAPGPVSQKPDDTTEMPDNGPFDGLLDLDGIKLTASSTPMILLSKAVGRLQSNGSRPEIQLSTSGWTHPSVYHTDIPWHGYTYWMAATPYPDIDSQYENPHIFCSNDGVNWREPAGIRNPIEPCPSVNAAYNSDVNLMMDNGTLYCYFRVSGVLSGRALYAMKSTDGVHWSEKELMCEWPVSGIDVIAPSVIKDEGRYYCYGVSAGESVAGSYYTSISIRRMVSYSPVNGFRPLKGEDYHLVTIEGRPWGALQDPWHLEVQKMDNIWLMLVTTTNHGGYGSGGRLFLGYSTDGLNFKFGTKPLGSLNSTYKSSFYPKYDPVTKKIHVQLWRATMGYGWAIFHDEFDVRTNFPVAV